MDKVIGKWLLESWGCGSIDRMLACCALKPTFYPRNTQTVLCAYNRSTVGRSQRNRSLRSSSVHGKFAPGLGYTRTIFKINK